jgi:pSer/pThr/pTyr-binding forkhead associated (FHA) protein
MDVPGVSRRHACIRIADDRVTIEDLESKNGTYVRGDRIASTIALNEGDELRLRSALLTLRAGSVSRTTETQAPTDATQPSSRTARCSS